MIRRAHPVDSCVVNHKKEYRPVAFCNLRHKFPQVLLAPFGHRIREIPVRTFRQSDILYLNPGVWPRRMARQQQIYPAFLITVTHFCPAFFVTGQLRYPPGFDGLPCLSVGTGGIHAGKYRRAGFHQLPGVLQLALGIIATAQPDPGVIGLATQHGAGVRAVRRHFLAIGQSYIGKEAFVAANQAPFHQRFSKLHVLSAKSRCHKAGHPETNLLFSANSRFRTNALSRVKPRSNRAGAAEAKRSCRSTNKRPGSMANTAEQPRERFTNFTPYEMKKGEDYMSADMLQHFKNLLLQWKQELMEEVDRTMHHMQEDAANYADPSDRATQEEEFSLELRTRDRERKLIKKIDQTIDRIDKDDYGFCDQCGVEIGIRRLEARPTATLCIDCKTLAEIRERQTGI